MAVPHLDYEIGNAGDLMRHEWLCRVLDWLPDGGRFLDPFAGPLTHQPSRRVRIRLTSAPAELRLRHLQLKALNNGRYLGSTMLARQVLATRAVVRSYDDDETRRKAYREHDIEIEEALKRGFDAPLLKGYHLINFDPANLFRPDPSKVALDPDNQDRVRAFWEQATIYKSALLIYVVNPDPQSKIVQRYHEYLALVRRRRLAYQVVIPLLPGSAVAGEDRYFYEVLYLPEKHDAVEAAWRRASLVEGARAMARTLHLDYAETEAPGYASDILEFITMGGFA